MSESRLAGSVHLYEKPIVQPGNYQNCIMERSITQVVDLQVSNPEPQTAFKKKKCTHRSVKLWVFVLCVSISMSIALAALSLSIYIFVEIVPTKEAIAFHATLGTYDTVLFDSSVVFSNVDLNLGEGYSATTGKFIVPRGGAGLYNMQLHLLVDLGEAATFQIRRNGRELCRAVGDQNHNGELDASTASCAASVLLEEGDEVDVLYDDGTDDTPLIEGAAPWQSFNGFRVSHR